MIPSTYRFQREYRIVGMRRCGQHAVANWIIRQTSGSAWNINDINPNHSISELSKLYTPMGRFYESGIATTSVVSALIDNLIYNHEDWKVDDIATVNQICPHDTFIGSSKQRYDVLVVRDPGNLFASRYHFRAGMPANAQRWQWDDGELWKNHAREYLNISNSLINNKIVIAFNRWVQDKTYRGSIAKSLGLEFTDSGIHDVSHIGSTFDVKTYQGQANNMDLTGRWRFAAKYPEYMEIFRDSEILDLSQNIFGKTCATDYINQMLSGTL